MKLSNIYQQVTVDLTPKEVYNIWLNSKKHSTLIGANAVVTNKIHTKIDLWDGSITGELIAIEKYKRISQALRFDYPEWDKSHFSIATLKLVPLNDLRTRIFFSHIRVPSIYAQEIKNGWKKYYWENLKKY